MNIDLEQLNQLAVLYGMRVLSALVILVVGAWLARLARRLMSRVINRRNIDQTVVSFLSNLMYAMVWLVVLIAVISKLGVQTASIIAVLGAMGLAVGLALQGSLSNLAAGVLLALFRPFRVGDFVEAASTMGTVEDIQIFTTRLKRPDGMREIVPNSRLLGDNIINYSINTQRRCNLVIGVSYDADVEHVRSVLLDLVNSDSRTLPEPAPMVILDSYGDSSINFALRAWANSSDYWTWYWDLLARLKPRFDAEGISIPFPQRDVHLYQADAPPARDAGAAPSAPGSGSAAA